MIIYLRVQLLKLLKALVKISQHTKEENTGGSFFLKNTRSKLIMKAMKVNLYRSTFRRILFKSLTLSLINPNQFLDDSCTLGYLIEVTPRLFIFRKKSYLHSLIRYPTIINFEVFPQKIVIFHRKWLYFEKNPTSILLLYTPCLFHILYLSDSTLIQYPTSI